MFRKWYRDANLDIPVPRELKEETIEQMRRQGGKKSHPVRRYALAAAALVLLAGASVFLFRPQQALPQAGDSTSSCMDKGGVVPVASQPAGGQFSCQAGEPAAGLLAAPTAKTEKSEAKDVEPVSESLSESVNQFSYQSAAQILGRAGSGENGLYSPLSLYMGLAMLTESTQGETQQELLKVLRVEEAGELPQQTASLYENQTLSNQIGRQTVSNSIWLNSNNQYNESFLQELADKYYAESYSVSFGTPDSAQSIANWVNRHTGGKLGGQAGSFETKEDTAALLLNTVYLNTPWTEPFDSEKNTAGVFHQTGGETVNATFMEKEVRSAYLTGDDGTVAAELVMENDSSMVFFLPKEGESPEELLSRPETILTLSASLLSRDADTYVTYQLPKFSYSAEISLKESMQALGVTRVFDEQQAGYFKLTDESPLCVDEIVQGTTVSVDENGCEAAAFTKISAYPTALAPAKKSATLRLDRPFVYAIVHDDLPVFIGVVNNPAKS